MENQDPNDKNDQRIPDAPIDNGLSSSSLVPPNNYDPVTETSPHQRRLFEKLLITISLVGGLTIVAAFLWFSYLGNSLINACNGVPGKVKAEEKSQEARFSKLIIVSGKLTHVTATGNTDCVDGGTNSVSVSGDMNVSGTYAAVKSDVDTNLGNANYKQIGQIYPQENTHYDAAGRTTFSGLQAGYKNSKGEYVEVTYNFATVYPYVCANGNKICNDPDLQTVQQAALSSISFDNNPWPHENTPSNNQTPN